MGKTVYYYFDGECKFYRSVTPDNFGNYSLRIKLNDIEEYKKSGIQGSIDDEGCVWLRRPQNKIINNELVDFGPPVTLDENEEELNLLVGEGSQVVAKVAVYDTFKGLGHRLEAVKVKDLVKVELDNTGKYNF